MNEQGRPLKEVFRVIEAARKEELEDGSTLGVALNWIAALAYGVIKEQWLDVLINVYDWPEEQEKAFLAACQKRDETRRGNTKQIAYILRAFPHTFGYDFLEPDAEKKIQAVNKWIAAQSG